MARSNSLIPEDTLTDREREILFLIREGKTNQEIAGNLHLTHGTVKWYASQIYSKIGVSNRVEAVIRADEMNLSHAPKYQKEIPTLSHRWSLPAQLTSFIGRKHEIETLTALLQQGKRLITLTGPPGVGKTRLAQEVVSQLSEAYRHGVQIVSLLGVKYPETLGTTFLESINLTESNQITALDQIQHSLQQKEILFLLDNFEHILPASSFISELLARCPNLTFVITSREALDIYGEVEFPIAPLASPKLSTSITLNQVLDFDSVKLFLDRAQSSSPDFTIDNNNMSAVSMICLHLDGLPLALELAAARIKYFAPQTLMMRLSSRLDILKDGPRDFPSRQRTLRATLRWSYDLLDGDEKQFFARLSVFRSGFAMESIEAVCGNNFNRNCFELLASLVDKSLVYQEILFDGSIRFNMLQTIREYADEKLQQSDELDGVYGQFANYYITLTRDATSRLYGHDHLVWLGIVENERDNLEAILEWSIHSANYAYSIDLIRLLTDFWQINGYFQEGLQWVQRLLEHHDSIVSESLSPLLFCAGIMYQRDDRSQACDLLEQAVAVARQHQNHFDEARALLHLGWIEFDQNLVTEGLQLYKQSNDAIGILSGLNISGEIARYRGDYEVAKEAYEACLDMAREHDNLWFIDVAETNLIFVDQHFGLHEQALARMKRVAKMNCQLNSLGCLLQQFLIASISIAELGDMERSLRILGAGETLMSRVGSAFSLIDYQEIMPAIETLRALLTEKQFALIYHDGTQLSLIQAYTEAYGVPDNDTCQLLENYFRHWID